MTNEKRLEQIKLNVPEAFKRRIQDAAMEENRSVANWIEVQLIRLLYLRDRGITINVDAAMANGRNGTDEDE